LLSLVVRQVQRLLVVPVAVALAVIAHQQVLQ
jgi:hypothetical protein